MPTPAQGHRILNCKLFWSLVCYIIDLGANESSSVGLCLLVSRRSNICTVESVQVPIYITGLVMGPLKLDHKGQSQVICKATGNRAKLCVSNQGTLSRMWKGNNHQVSEITLCSQDPIKVRCHQPSSFAWEALHT